MRIIWKIFKGILMTIGAIWLISFAIVVAVAYAEAPEYGPEGTISVKS